MWRLLRDQARWGHSCLHLPDRDTSRGQSPALPLSVGWKADVLHLLLSSYLRDR